MIPPITKIGTAQRSAGNVQTSKRSGVVIQAALNGSRLPHEHPRIPTTPAGLAADGLSCVQAGANSLHLHVRAPASDESLSRWAVAETLTAVRRSAPGIPIGLSTGLWITGSHEKRLKLVATWTEVPDFASVNFDETGATELACALLDRGIGVEAGLANHKAAQRLMESELEPHCTRILIEPEATGLTAARCEVERIEDALETSVSQCPRLLHGFDETAWPLLRDAVARGYEVRIGLEDVLVLSDRTPARDNEALLIAAQRLVGTYP